MAELMTSSIYPAVFAAALVIVLFSLALVRYWGELEIGQRVYACIVMLLSPCVFLFVPYQNPVNGQVHWRVFGDAPRYEDATMKKVMTPEFVKQLEKTIEVSPDLIANSTTRPMTLSRGIWRATGLGLFAIALIGWFVVPPVIDRIVYRRPKAKINGD